MADGWCYGPVLCERREDGRIDMWCVDWADHEDGTPCPWKHTARNGVAARIRGTAHAATHH